MGLDTRTNGKSIQLSDKFRMLTKEDIEERRMPSYEYVDLSNTSTHDYRILAHIEEAMDNIYYTIHRVYYKNGLPQSYSEKSVEIFMEDVEDLDWELGRIKLAKTKPVLWAGDKFPQEYKTK